MKMSGYGIIGSSDLILLDSYQDSLNIYSNLTMIGTIVGIPGKYSHCRTMSWDNYFTVSKISNNCLYMEVMSNSKVTEHLFDAHYKLNKLFCIQK